MNSQVIIRVYNFQDTYCVKIRSTISTVSWFFHTGSIVIIYASDGIDGTSGFDNDFPQISVLPIIPGTSLITSERSDAYEGMYVRNWF